MPHLEDFIEGDKILENVMDHVEIAGQRLVNTQQGGVGNQSLINIAIQQGNKRIPLVELNVATTQKGRSTQPKKEDLPSRMVKSVGEELEREERKTWGLSPWKWCKQTVKASRGIRDIWNYWMKMRINESKKLKICEQGEELILESRVEWNIELVKRIFSKEDNEKILQMPISQEGSRGRLVWHWEKNGNFSVKSAYRRLVAEAGLKRDLPESSNGTDLYRKCWAKFLQV
ncbi:hypothetical protein DH2020_046722 [Rehmannia glutinosa]|uniref:Uncharacterized protein n=1 Tax=Rehmannia glutinosa TaxID=99300 RepID=A0ABR0UAH3_REHGL